jgi:hypothetical protein
MALPSRNEFRPDAYDEGLRWQARWLVGLSTNASAVTLEHVMRRNWVRAVVAFAVLAVALLSVWLWLYRGWRSEQATLDTLNCVDSSHEAMVLPWVSAHVHGVGFVLERTTGVTIENGPAQVDLSQLAHLGYLKSVIVCSGRVDDLTPLARLTKLEWLALTYEGTGDLRPLAQLARLRQLSLENSRITDISPLAGLPQLDHLWLEVTRVGDVHPLDGLQSLRSLYLPADTVTEQQARDLQRKLPQCEVHQQ